jgi:hypothetical protein
MWWIVAILVVALIVVAMIALNYWDDARRYKDKAENYDRLWCECSKAYYELNTEYLEYKGRFPSSTRVAIKTSIPQHWETEINKLLEVLEEDPYHFELDWNYDIQSFDALIEFYSQSPNKREKKLARALCRARNWILLQVAANEGYGHAGVPSKT